MLPIPAAINTSENPELLESFRFDFSTFKILTCKEYLASDGSFTILYPLVFKASITFDSISKSLSDVFEIFTNIVF